ncbi:MAG: acyltransferase [Hymenobacter sp.]|nr:MAG: acyltransferase [Hymenobacter sp.]
MFQGQGGRYTQMCCSIAPILRGFCAFYVVVYHARYILWAGGHEYLVAFPRVTWSIWQYAAFIIDMLSGAGYEMVIFFFVLSGFFIRYAQLRKPRAAGNFYINRIVRIYPPYLVSVALAATVLLAISRCVPQMITLSGNRALNTTLMIARDNLRMFNLTDMVRTLLFLPLQNQVYIGYNGVYWSLLPEALFYAVVPLAFWRVRAYYVLSVILYVIGIVATSLHYQQGEILTFLLTYNFYFAVGAAIHDIVVKTEWLLYVGRMPGWLLSLTAIVLFGLLLLLALLKLKSISGLIAVLIAILMISSLLAGRVARHNWVLRIFHPVGIFSFSLYLYHFPLLILCSSLLTVLTGNIIFYIRYYWLAIPIVTLACYCLYWLTERVSVNFFRKI